MFLKENSVQDVLDQASDTQSARILLALLNVFSPKKEQKAQQKFTEGNVES